MRRRRKLLKNIIIIAISVAFVLIMYNVFFKKMKKIDSSNESTNLNDIIELQNAERPKVEIILPDKIYDQNNTTSAEKTYEPISSTEDIEKQKKYLETITSADEITIILGDDAQELLPENSVLKVGGSYMVDGIQEKMKTTYCFNVEGYRYPVILALTQSGTLQFIDAEEAFKTGTFRITKTIDELQDVDKIYETKAEEKGNSYSTAIIVLKSGEGHELNLKMINK